MKPIKSFLLLFLTLIFVLGLSSTSVFAEDTETDAIITVEPSKVEIKAEQDSNHFAATFQLKASQDVTNVRILLTDMKPADEETTYSILPSEITVTSTDGSDDLVENVSSEWVITVGEGITEPGMWEGTATIEWESPAPGDSEAVTFEIAIESTEEKQGEAGLLELEKLVVAGVRNQSCEDCPRTILINETTGETELKGLKVTLNDLRSDDTPPKVYTKDNIDSVIGDDQQYPSAGLSFKYDDVKAGLYKGKVWLIFDNADDLELPVEVYVKDGKGWPIVVMVLGLGLAIGITNYIQNRREKDLLLIKINNLLNFTKSLAENESSKFSTPFINQMNLILIEQKAKLDDAEKNELTTINAEITKARDIRTKWKIWQEIHKEKYEEYMSRLKTLKDEWGKIHYKYPNSLLIKTAYTHLVDLWNGNVVNYDTVDQFRENLDCIGKNLTDYEGWLKTLDTLEATIKKSTLTEEKQKQFIDQETGSIPVLRKKLLGLEEIPLDVEKCKIMSWNEIKTDYEKIAEDYEAALKTDTPEIRINQKMIIDETRSKKVWEDIKSTGRTIITTLKEGYKKLKDNPKVRIAIFKVVTLLTSLVILVLVGYTKYENNASFGSFADYSGLFLWAFGIGAAEGSAFKLIQGWGINIPTPE